MLLRIYSVYDNKALQYHTPFFTHTDGSALRSFAELFNDANTTVGRHPGDYSLWFLGVYDDSNGTIEQQLPLTHVADATALVQHAPRLPIDTPEATRLARPNGGV